jgi:dynein heavy chain
MTVLDDQIVKLQTMLGSPYIKPIKGRCAGFEKRLQYLQCLLDEWLATQKTWMYLEPIFGSEDIMRQMPVEGRRFASVNTFWRATMEELQDRNETMEVAANEKLLSKFRGCNTNLDKIQKGLNDYLEIKRLAFPRFYFLSADELLEILSQTKNPLAVQPFLGKCFEGIQRVTFDENNIITHMISGQKETVKFITTIDPNKGQNKGNVENWLTELLNCMRVSIKGVVIDSMKTYREMKKIDWIAQWPAMVAIGIGSMFWTRDIEKAIQSSSLPAFLQVQIDDSYSVMCLLGPKAPHSSQFVMQYLVRRASYFFTHETNVPHQSPSFRL